MPVYLLLTALCLSFTAEASIENDRLDRYFQGQVSLNTTEKSPWLQENWDGQPWISKQGEGLPKRLAPVQQIFLASMRRASGVVAHLDESNLDGLLADIVKPSHKPPLVKWWDAFLNWLDNLNTDHYDMEFDWLVNLLRTITPSERTSRMMLYIVFTLTILAAVAIVAHEIYLSGLLSNIGKWRRRGEKNVRENLPSRQGLADTDLQSLPPERQVAWLLRYCIEYLTKRGEIPNNPALTNRELQHWLTREHSKVASAFTALTELAEPVLYGDKAAGQQVLRCCRQRTDDVLSR